MAETGFGPEQSMDLTEALKEVRGTAVPGISVGIQAALPVEEKRDELYAAAGCGPAGFGITGTDLGPTGWDFTGLIETFQAQTPSDVAQYFASAGPRELSRGISRSYESELRTGAGPEKDAVVVEVTQILINAPFHVLQKMIPAEEWGLNLAHRLGGEVRVVEKGADGRAVRQLERMVLSGVPFAAVDCSLINQDMTKAELIRYGEDSTKVYWRVYRSDNDSTKVDIGSVEFRAYDATSVLVTFYSAHRLRGLEFLPKVAKRALSQTFLDHAQRYKSLVEGNGGADF